MEKEKFFTKKEVEKERQKGDIEKFTCPECGPQDFDFIGVQEGYADPKTGEKVTPDMPLWNCAECKSTRPQQSIENKE